MKTIACLLAFVFITCSSSQDTNNDVIIDNAKYLQLGLPFRINKPGNLEIFCFLGRQKLLTRIWETVFVRIHSSKHYDQYLGASPEEVAREFEMHHYSWKVLGLFSYKSNTIQLNPFNHSCVGIHSKEPYRIELAIIHVDYWRILITLGGILLVLMAGNLSNNSLFYYICGISIGVCASFLVVVYFFSRLLPQRPVMYGVLIGGWTISVYFLQLLWDNLRIVLEQYRTHVLAYVTSVGIVSFAVCYRFGPVTDTRSRNLIKWTLQGGGILCVLFSSWFQEATLLFSILLVAVYNFPSIWVSKFRTYWRQRFPPPVKLLSEDEFHEQGVRETQRALQQLRSFCSSPECDTWRTVLHIRDPVRFAEFMSGSSHLSDCEILAYESTSRRCGSTNLEDSDSDDVGDEDLY